MRWTSTARIARSCSFLLIVLVSLRGGLAPLRAQAQAVPAGEGLVADSTELRVLRQFYQATGGDQWSNHTNWLQGTTLAEAATWYGVGVSGGDVTSLDFFNNHLVGPLPASLGQLRGLVSLSVYANQLTGPVPPELGQLTRLQSLTLAGNGLTGALPTELGQLTELRNFNADYNQLTGPLPASLGNWPLLQALSITNNQLTGPIPNRWGQLRALVSLQLDHNQLAGPLPDSLGDCAQLAYVRLGVNQLTGPLPARWGRLRRLGHLWLAGNRLSGVLPDSINNWHQLTTLGLDYNQFSGPLPQHLEGLTALSSLGLNDNQFTGPLPASFGQLPALSFCVLSRNQFTGPLPTPTGAGWRQLTYLDAAYNQLTGVIPAGLLRAPSLSLLDLTGNNLTDVAELGGATGLPANSRLSGNQLSFAALERLFSGPGRARLAGVEGRGQRPPAGVDTVGYVAGGPLVLRVAAPAAAQAYAYQWQRWVGGQWVDMPGDTLVTKTWPQATAAEQGTYRRQEHNRWFTDPGTGPTALYSAAFYADLLPYQALAQNRPVDASQFAVPTLAAPLDLASAPASPAADLNFVRVWSPRVALTDSTRVPRAPVDSVGMSTQYLDGLGRPVQTVQRQASPQRHDLVQPQAYDALGRERYQFLPYASPAHTGAYRPAALTEQDHFYRDLPATGPPSPADLTTGVARTGAAYAETQFEASPLNRVTAQGAAGEAWQLTAGHVIERQERPNTAADSVLWFQPGYEATSLDPGYRGCYAPGELWGTDVADAHGPSEPGAPGYRTIEWKDKLGQVVLKQVEAARVKLSSGALRSRWLRTAYVYDDFGHLRFVLQPEGVKRLLASLTPSPSPAGLRVALACDQASGTQALDASGQGRPGQLLGGEWVASPAGPHAHALRLSGPTRPRLLIPLLIQPSAFTVAFWVKPGQLSNYSCMLNAHIDNGSGDPWGSFAFHTTQDGTVAVGINYWDPNGRIVTGPGVVQAGRWQHFVFTYDHGTGTLYRDGYQLASLAGMPPSLAWPNLLVGTSTNAEPFDGDLSELRVYERALAASEVQQLAQPEIVTALQPYLFHYRYDGRGRQIAKQVPGQVGETVVVYDQLDRPVLSQDASQRQRREWSWTKYDALGRVILVGLVSRADTLGPVSLQALATADTAAVHQYEQRTAAGARYPHYLTTDQSFPRLGQQGFDAGRVLSVTHYDDYDFDNDGQADVVYDPSSDGQFPSGQAPVADALRTTGAVTRTRTRVLGVAETTDLNQPAAWLTTTTFYDARARPVQVQTSNARRGLDVLTTQLDFPGKVVQSVAVHRGPNHAPLPVAEFFTYDHTGRLLTSRQQLPGEARAALLDSVSYNELGQATRKTLGTGRLKQDVDYAYNIRGWLTSVNNPYTPDPADLFNLSLHYERGFTAGYEQYNGNLTGQTWRGRDGVQRAYGYVYDPLNRLLQGDFVARQTTTVLTPLAGAWQAEADNYRLSFVSYDDNGNLLTLRRRGLLHQVTHASSKQYGAVDNLSYTYQGNRLLAVDDAVTGNQLPRPTNYHGAPTSLAGDFQEQGVRLGEEYLYDANGNLTQDKNKGLTGIVYNHLNLPTQLHFGQVGDSVVFRYAASGQKVAKLVYQTGKSVQRTDYLGPYQYEQDSLKFFSHAEGRVLRFVAYDAARQARVSYQREFTLKDHLGNLRLAYRLGQTRTYLASLEQDSTTRRRETQQFDSLSVSPPVAVATAYARSGQYAARLNAGGSAPQPLGPLTQLTVQQGDSLRVRAPGLYPQKVASSGFVFSLASFVAGLVQPPPAGTPAPVDGSRRGGLPLLQLGLSAGVAALPQLSGGVPKGYLRVLVFNQDSALVDQRTLSLSQAALGNYEVLDTQWLSIHQNGYVSVYVGTESPADVYFDELTVEHRQGVQVQETQYDPAGLELAGLVAPSPGIRGLNNYRFNGKEFQADLGLNWNHQDWRFLDPQLLRWHSVDPEIENEQESWTPYSFGFDNALRYADANGRAPGEGWSGFGGGFAAGYVGTFTGVRDAVVHAVQHPGETLAAAPAAYGRALLATTAPVVLLAGQVQEAAELVTNVVHGNGAAVGHQLGQVAAQVTIAVATEGASRLVGRALRTPCGCFTAGTGVSTRLGRKPIEQIQVGDSVWAYNERTRQTALRPVTQLFRYVRDTVYVLHTATGEILRTTSDHPFYVRGQWVRVKRLRVGDSLVSQSGQRHVLRRIEQKPEHVTVYNFTVDDLHTYFVGQQAILVHNTSCPPAGSTKAASGAEQINPTELQPTHGPTMSNRQFNKLKADVKANGMNEPVTYTEHNGSKYILNGHHRVRAANALGMPSVPAQKVSLPHGSYRTPTDLIYQH